MYIESKTREICSLQIGYLGDIPQGTTFEIQSGFLVKNNNSEAVEVTIETLHGGQVTTMLDSGWNPEIIRKIYDAPEGLQYGY